MSTCRGISAQIVAENDLETKAALQEQLKSREKSHRDPLKSKEKALRGDDSVSLAVLVSLYEECECELAEDDSILKRVRNLVNSKESHWQEILETKLSSKKSQTVKALEELSTTVQRELGAATSDRSKELLQRISSLLEARRKSHRVPLAKELEEQRESGTMKDLGKLKQRICLELSESDEIVKDVIAVEKARDASVRAKLVSKFTSLIKDLKKTKSSSVHDFMKMCEAELDENDPLLSQVRSTLENKMLESKGMKPVHNMDDLERGEREKVTDDAPVSRPSKKSASSKSESSKKKSSSSSSKNGKSSISSSIGNTSIVSNAVEVISGFKSDLSGAPPTSAFYKLGIIMVFLMYLAIVGYSTSLAFKVAKLDIDMSQVTERFSLPKTSSSEAVADALTGSSAAKAASSNAASSASKPAVAASASSASSASSGDDDDSGGGGGGDDDD